MLELQATHGPTDTYLYILILYCRWTNPSQDLIVCQKCRAVVAITFHPLLQAADEERITAIYKDKLCTAHDVTCPFYANAFPTTNVGQCTHSELSWSGIATRLCDSSGTVESKASITETSTIIT